MVRVIVVLCVVCLLGCAGDPLAVDMPNTVHERNVGKEFRRAVESLEPDELALLNMFFVGWDQTGGGSFPEGFTIGAAIDTQRQIYMRTWGRIE